MPDHPRFPPAFFPGSVVRAAPARWRAPLSSSTRTTLATLTTLSTLTVLLLALSGCAGQMAYREGNDLAAQDQVEAALQKYQEALNHEPDNAGYRAAYRLAREKASARLLGEGDRYAATGKPELAALSYRRVLGIDQQNERAREGLRLIETNARLDKLLAEAGVALAGKQPDLARQKLVAVLAERPGNERARTMLRDTTEKSAPPAETGLSRAYKQAVTIEFRDAPLKQVFEIISRRSGLNFVFDKDVKVDTKTSIFLKNSTVESAIYFLLLTNQLEQQVMDDNTILIYPNVAAKQKDYQEMTVKTFYLANAEAKLVANTLKTILKTRDVVVDEKLNLLIVRDSPEAIRLAERLIKTQDVSEPEVMLEVEVLEVNRERAQDLGVLWPSGATLTPLTTTGGATLSVFDLQHISSSSLGISGLGTSINAQAVDTDSKILANPRIRVRNHEKSKILIGEKVPVISSTVSPGVGGFVSESVSYVDVGLTLNAEPTIYLNDEVGIRISLEVSSVTKDIPTASGNTVYQIGTRQASTMLQLKDGENQVLAGLINDTESNSGTKIPGIGDLPLLDHLFGTKHGDHSNSEIVLSITPHIVRSVQRPELSASEFSAGTETSFRRRPDMTPRLPTQLPTASSARSGQAQGPGQGQGQGQLAPGYALPAARVSAAPTATPTAAPMAAAQTPAARPASVPTPQTTLHPAAPVSGAGIAPVVAPVVAPISAPISTPISTPAADAPAVEAPAEAAPGTPTSAPEAVPPTPPSPPQVESPGQPTSGMPVSSNQPAPIQSTLNYSPGQPVPVGQTVAPQLPVQPAPVPTSDTAK